MILLSGHSLTHDRRVPLEALSLSLKERESTATMTPASMTGIGVSSWFLDDTEPGRGIVWRVKSIGEAYATNTPTLQLEHVINTLRDRIMFGEITAATITGNSEATSCTAEQAVRYILSYQGDWVLGSFGYSLSNPYKFDGDTLFDALETVTASLSNACWTYDMSAYPFRLNIVNKDSTVGSELRAGRNLKTITKTIDKSSMYTRFYPIGKDDLHIAGNYVERNANAYGVIEKVETDASIDTEAELRRWANERLDVHAEPNVTIDVEGYELANATGESLDRMVLGRACRVPLPEYGTTIQERIVTLTYPDKVHQPDVFKATLANNREDVTKIIADSMKKGGKSGRTSTKQSKEDHAWIEDTEDHVALCAEAIIGGSPDGVDWRRFSTIIVDGEGIHQRVIKTENDVVTAFTQIDLNEQRILLEAQRAQGAEGALSGRITVEADRITQEVTERKAGEVTMQGKITVQANRITQEVTDRTNADTVLEGKITVQANRITAEVSRATNEEEGLKGMIDVQAERVAMTVGVTDSRPIRYVYQTSLLPRPGDSSVIYYCYDTKKYYEWISGSNSYHETTPGKYIKAGDICVAINESGETEAVIEADKIYLLGQTIADTITANYISTKIASIATLSVQAISATGSIHASSLEANNIYVISADSQGHQVNTSLKDSIKELQITSSGNTYTLQKKSYSDSDWVDVDSFSRATTLTGTWASGVYTVSASPQSVSDFTSLTNTGHWGNPNNHIDGDNDKPMEDANTYYYKTYATRNGQATTYFTGNETTIDGSGRYTAGESAGKNSGWNSCRAAMEIPTSDIGSVVDGTYDKATVKKPDADQASTKTSYELALNINSSFRPQGSTSDIKVAELKYGGNVVARKTVPSAITALGIYDTNSIEKTGTINLGWNGSIDLWGGYKDDGSWRWGSKLTVKGKALPTIDNVDRKSTGVSGTNAGDVSSKTGSYVTFDMAGSSYYIKIS